MRKIALPWHGWTWDITGKEGSQWFCAPSEAVWTAGFQGMVEAFHSVNPVSFLWIKRLIVCEQIAAWLYFAREVPIGSAPANFRESGNDDPIGSSGGSPRVRGAPINLPRAPGCANKFARRPVSRVLSACFHGGRPFLWDAPRDAPLATNPNGEAGTPPLLPPEGGAAAVPIRSCSRWGLPCRPCCQGRGALLPHRFALARGSRTLARAVCFLWHCPWGRHRRPLAGTVFPWSPDFPLCLLGHSGRPAVWQARDMSAGTRRVKRFT